MSPLIAATICANLLNYYPTESPLQIAVGNSVVLTCNHTSTFKPLRLTFKSTADVGWWQTNRPDRPIIDEDDDG